MGDIFFKIKNQSGTIRAGFVFGDLCKIKLLAIYKLCCYIVVRCGNGRIKVL